MIVSIHQLHYLPWLRYFHKIALSDTFVVLDNIQFNKNGWQNRNKIKAKEGALCLTVPVYQKSAQRLCEVAIDNKQPWRRKHWGSVSTVYRKAPYFRDHEPFFRGVLERDWDKLTDVNYEILFYLVKALGLKARIIRGSALATDGEGTRRLIRICKEVGADAYLTGAYAAETYLDTSLFQSEGLRLCFQSFHCPEYPQLFPEAGFIPDLSVVDLLFNCGPRSLDILMQDCHSKASEEAG